MELGNDIKMCVYADDTALFCHDKSTQYVQLRLQEALDKVLRWINCNLLELNVKKKSPC